MRTGRKPPHPIRFYGYISIGVTHQMGLYAIINSWEPQAVINTGLTANDGYLAENWYASDGKVRTVPTGAAYVQQLKDNHIPIYITATGASRINSVSPKIIKTWIAGSEKVAGGQYIAISDENYSSQTDFIEPAAIIHKLTKRSWFTGW